MKLTRRRLTRLVIGAFALVLAALGSLLGWRVAHKQDSRAEATALCQIPEWLPTNDAEASRLLDSPGELLGDAERAVAIAPDLEVAHAFRAWIAARLGDEATANRELERAGTGMLARRAKAFVLFRKGEVNEALALFAQRTQILDHFELMCADDRWFEEGQNQYPPPRWPSWWQTILSQEPDDVLSRLERIELKAPGSIEALTALRARARIEALVFDDTAAERDIARACTAPPHERAFAEPDRAAITKLISSARELEPVPPLKGAGAVDKQAVWQKLADKLLKTAYAELNRDELFDSNDDLDRAERRLLRLVAIVSEPRAELALARALERRPQRNELPLVKLSVRLAQRTGPGELERYHELARIAFVRGDLQGAKTWLAKLGPIAPENLQARLLKAVLERDHKLAAAAFGLPELKEANELGGAMKAALAIVLERPWEVRVELDSFEAIYPRKFLPNIVAMARLKDDPIGTLLALVRSGDRLAPAEKETLADGARLLLNVVADDVHDRLELALKQHAEEQITGEEVAALHKILGKLDQPEGGATPQPESR